MGDLRKHDSSDLEGIGDHKGVLWVFEGLVQVRVVEEERIKARVSIE
jgi:hypothetical protein